MPYKHLTVQNTQAEVQRLSANWRALLDAMPEMVFLLGDTCTVEYMNRSAKASFSKPCPQPVCDSLKKIGEDCQQKLLLASEHPGDSKIIEALIGTTPVEYSFVPFAGYKGENLIMLVVRDISQRKNFERELLQFNTSIETILEQKISELHESEGIRIQLSRQVNSLKSQLGHHHKADKMVGRSRKMRELREMIHQVSGSDATILITGESGTGKELVANLIKATSTRDDKPFLKINCNAINDSLLEADLFGYEKGAFTWSCIPKNRQI